MKILRASVLLSLLTAAAAVNSSVRHHHQLDEHHPFLRRQLSGACSDTCEDFTCPLTGPTVAQLYAGQHTGVGEVQAELSNESTIKVTYKIDWPGLCMKETHLQVFACSDLDFEDKKDEPKWLKNGGPVPGQFDHKVEHRPCVYGSFEYHVSVTGITGEICVAAHAALSNGETAWAGEEDFAGANWATYFKVEDPECIYPCESLGEKGKGVAVRFKDFKLGGGTKEFYAGAGDLGNSACRASPDQSLSYVYGSEMPFSVSFDGVNERLHASITIGGLTTEHSNVDTAALRTSSGPPSCTTQLGYEPAAPAELNAIAITVVNRYPGDTPSSGEVRITDVTFNGTPLGDFCVVGGDKYWLHQSLFLPDYDFSTTTTTIEGKLLLCGEQSDFDKGEFDKVEILFYKAKENPFPCN